MMWPPRLNVVGGKLERQSHNGFLRPGYLGDGPWADDMIPTADVRLARSGKETLSVVSARSP
jgi:hypothetical protein